MRRRGSVSALAGCLALLSGGVARAADEREPFDAHLYVGDSVSSFSASEVKRFENPADTNEVRQGFVAGLDFDYRLKRWSDARNLWIFGETVHGLRSVEVDCRKNPDAAPCVSGGLSGTSALFVIRNSRSLEAYLGFQLDLARVNPDTEHEGRIFLRAQGGFMTVARSGADFVDNHFAGLGVTLVTGRFRGSYLDGGWGRTDLYFIHRDDRLKIDGYLTWAPGKGLRRPRRCLRGFAEFYVDTDVGRGSDTALVYFGVELDVDDLLSGAYGE
jgi:hypothetical protein